MAIWAVALAGLVICQPQPAQANLVYNGSFEVDSDRDGLADGWLFVPMRSDKIDATYSLEPGIKGLCQRLSCTRFEGGHVMLAQVGKVAVQAGKWYVLEFWARGQGIGTARVAIQDTRVWRHVGLYHSFSPTARWRHWRIRFAASASVSETSRLQFWFLSTGTLWLDEVVLHEAKPPPPEYIVPPADSGNLLLNASFELGSWAWTTAGYWRLLGDVIEPSQPPPHGRRCVRIRWDPKNPAVQQGDYYKPHVEPVTDLALNCPYWIRLKPGQRYVLSGWAKSDSRAPGRLQVMWPNRRGATRRVVFGEKPGWQRYELLFTAQSDLCGVFFGPEGGGERPFTVLIDAIQLEPGDSATEFRPRFDVEAAPRAASLSVRTSWPAPLPLAFDVVNYADQPRRIELRWTVTDIFDQPRGEGSAQRNLKPGQRLTVRIPDATAGKGVRFARLSATANGFTLPPLRCAILPYSPAPSADTPFGCNHAYPWDDWLKVIKTFGIRWIRDWSLQWQVVEPQPGDLDPSRAARWVLRQRRVGLRTLVMFPFPSSVWAAEQPPKPPKNWRTYRPWQIACRPRDMAAFRRYIRECTRYFAPYIDTWEIFNESWFTSYSLPRSFGYGPEAYVPLLKAAFEEIKSVQPRSTVIGGYSGGYAHFAAYQTMHRLGGGQFCDAISVHAYPGAEPEGLYKGWLAIHKLFRKPLWLTEFGYYADDDLPASYRPGHFPGLVENEFYQAAWSVRACALALQAGIDKIFFHVNWWHTPPLFDRGHIQLLEPDGELHKVAVALSAMLRMLGDSPDPVALWTRDDAYCAIFRRRGRLVAMLWSIGETPATGPAPEGRYYDMAARPLRRPPTSLTDAPLYLLPSARTPKALQDALEKWLGQAGQGASGAQ